MVWNKYIGKLMLAKIEMIVKSYKNDVRLIIVVQIIETTKKRIPILKIINGVNANFFLRILIIIVAISPPIITKTDSAVTTKTIYLRMDVAILIVKDFWLENSSELGVSLPIKFEFLVIGQGPPQIEVGLYSSSLESPSWSIGSLVRFSSDGKVTASPAQSEDGLESFCSSSTSVAKVESVAKPQIKIVRVTKARSIFLNIL
jgi:hypothetical protein